ncbi:glycosyltransferase [Pedobacter alpinus]|uniref:Glycosyltransferase n=1 Tax=Pedobacter alpinus TaxID=1590643 RepID=A0ABW5TPT0_9SPHI
MKLFIIHPGIQHSPRLANGANRSGLFKNITLLTSVLYKPSDKVFGILKKRVKPIDKEIKIINHYLYTLLYSLSKFLYNKIIVNPNNQSHNNPIYFWQQIFGYLCLPSIYLNRKNLMVVCFETTGWPVVKYCNKWNIPVIMDFASISHEKAKTLGINETPFGIDLKLKERVLIDYGFYCSKFCRDSFEGMTSAKKEFVLYLGAERREMQAASSKKQDIGNMGKLGEMQESSSNNQALNSPLLEVSSQQIINLNDNNKSINSIKLSFIANLEYRKGLDIFLEGVYGYEYSAFVEVHLIGRIREEWVSQHLPKTILNKNIKLIYQPAMSQGELFNYLRKEAFDLNVQTSRFDSFAMVVPETMMQGIPNVVSPFVGAGEMITHEKDGFIMDRLDSEHLSNILKYYIQLNQQERNELKLRVLASSKNMIWENYYIQLGKVFKEILADNR